MMNKYLTTIGISCIAACLAGYTIGIKVTKPVEIVKIKEVIKYRDRPKSKIDLGKEEYHSKDTNKIINSLLNKNIKQIHGMKPRDLRNICRSTLVYLGVPNSEVLSWVDLLMITAKIESNCGYLACQVRGPAKGVFQLEPSTEKDLWNRVIKKDKLLYKKIRDLRCNAHLGRHEAEYNIAYACSMAYLEYKSRKVNPVNMTVQDMVLAHKVYYNTYLGKTSKEHAWKNLAGAYNTGLISSNTSNKK